MKHSEEYEYFYNIMIVGDAGVGKTPFFHRFLHGTMLEKTDPTVGVDFGSRVVKVDNHMIKAQLWDAAGREIFRVLVGTYFKTFHGFLLMYDMTKESSFENMKKWLKMIREINQNSAPIMLVCNKIDVIDMDPLRVLEALRERGVQFARENNLLFEETSVILGLNVNETVDKLLQEIHSGYKNCHPPQGIQVIRKEIGEVLDK